MSTELEDNQFMIKQLSVGQHMTEFSERLAQRMVETEKVLKEQEDVRLSVVEYEQAKKALDKACFSRYTQLLTTTDPTPETMEQLKRIQRTLLGPNHVQNINVNVDNYHSLFGSSTRGYSYYGD